MNETKSQFFEKINKADKPLERVTKKKGRELKSIKSEMKNEKLPLSPQKCIIRDYYNFTPILHQWNGQTQMKWRNSQKDTSFQD